ncbi:endolytic transglycosylase MltG [Rhodobacteraceae bacterium 2CG4]|uniref:Endolytic murein transglycosylase n=1 Tax=Halovulum marinum TaxID=2662447 RepID=A0A6L5YZ64_9RHOB|nr:endolytic transglycosylase MltG [Halovulum marinum]MSU88994.1 endolytic transglycosylase MltG [Halovulum marinum]
MARHLAANGITLLIVALVVAIGMLEWGRGQFAGPGPLTEDTVVEVPSGANLSRVTDELTEVGAISHPLVFRIAARMQGADEELKLGCYALPARATMAEILERVTTARGSQACYQATFVVNNRGTRLRIRDAAGGTEIETVELDEGLQAVDAELDAGGSVQMRVSVAEGLTVRDILTGLAQVPYLSGDVAETPAEGMLAPDTYEFTREMERAQLVARMQTVQETRLAEAWESRGEDLPVDSPEELLTLASIVEKETGVAEERGLVAAVFANRLQQGMRLQTDPTIIYGITRGGEPMEREISRSDIDGVTERQLHGEVQYNTYQIDGLPPGPIANPGRASLMAAAAPDESPYLFFVADGTGGHAFAETLDEHNRNVANYRALNAGQ